jgi:hypothetical protein
MPTSGEIVVSPDVTTEYTLTATNESGSVSRSVTLTVETIEIPLPTISFFTATPDVIDPGQFTSLSWATEDADTVSIIGMGQVQASGSVILNLEETTTYVLSAVNATGETRAELTVTVRATPEPSINFFTAAPDTIREGEFATLSWSTEYADEVTISGLGRVLPAGSILVSPEETTTYTLTATSAIGTVTADVVVTVEPANTPPVASAGRDQTVNFPNIVTLDGSGSYDPDGDPLTYSWVQVGGTPVQLNGPTTVNPTFSAGGGSYTFRLTVQDPRGFTDTDEVTISVVSFKTGGQR